MAVITPVAASSNAAVTYAAATAGGDTIAVGTNQRCTLIVRNASAGSITVTITAVVNCNQGYAHNLVVTCAVGDTEISVPPLYVNTAGNASVTYSAAASITVAAVTS